MEYMCISLTKFGCIKFCCVTIGVGKGCLLVFLSLHARDIMASAGSYNRSPLKTNNKKRSLREWHYTHDSMDFVQPETSSSACSTNGSRLHQVSATLFPGLRSL